MARITWCCSAFGVSYILEGACMTKEVVVVTGLVQKENFCSSRYSAFVGLPSIFLTGAADKPWMCLFLGARYRTRWFGVMFSKYMVCIHGHKIQML